MSEFVCHTDGVNADRKELDKDLSKTGTTSTAPPPRKS